MLFFFEQFESPAVFNTDKKYLAFQRILKRLKRFVLYFVFIVIFLIHLATPYHYDALENSCLLVYSETFDDQEKITLQNVDIPSSSDILCKTSHNRLTDLENSVFVDDVSETKNNDDRMILYDMDVPGCSSFTSIQNVVVKVPATQALATSENATADAVQNTSVFDLSNFQLNNSFETPKLLNRVKSCLIDRAKEAVDHQQKPPFQKYKSETFSRNTLDVGRQRRKENSYVIRSLDDSCLNIVSSPNVDHKHENLRRTFTILKTKDVTPMPAFERFSTPDLTVRMRFLKVHISISPFIMNLTQIKEAVEKKSRFFTTTYKMYSKCF